MGNRDPAEATPRPLRVHGGAVEHPPGATEAKAEVLNVARARGTWRERLGVDSTRWTNVLSEAAGHRAAPVTKPTPVQPTNDRRLMATDRLTGEAPSAASCG